MSSLHPFRFVDGRVFAVFCCGTSKVRLGWLIQCRVRAAPRYAHTRLQDGLKQDSFSDVRYHTAADRSALLGMYPIHFSLLLSSHSVLGGNHRGISQLCPGRFARGHEHYHVLMLSWARRPFSSSISRFPHSLDRLHSTATVILSNCCTRRLSRPIDTSRAN